METAKDRRDAEVGDLQMAPVRKKQVLQLDVTVCNPIPMQVRHSLEQLFEEAELIFNFKIILFHQGEQVPVPAVLHDMVPAASVGAETHGFHNIRMVCTVGNAELGLDFLLVLFLVLALDALSELLYRVLGGFRAPFLYIILTIAVAPLPITWPRLPGTRLASVNSSWSLQVSTTRSSGMLTLIRCASKPAQVLVGNEKPGQLLWSSRLFKLKELIRASGSPSWVSRLLFFNPQPVALFGCDLPVSETGVSSGERGVSLLGVAGELGSVEPVEPSLGGVTDSGVVAGCG